MKKGGYKILDLQNKNIVNGAYAIVDGVYEAIESTTKPLLLSGLRFNDVEYRDTYVTATVSGQDYKIVVNGFTITITSADHVSVVTNK